MRLRLINRWLTLKPGIFIILFCISFMLLLPFVGMAQVPVEPIDPNQERISRDTIFVTLTAIPIFFMNLGYALWYAGFCGEQPGKAIRQNLIILALSIFAFWVIGFGLMFGDGNNFFGLEGMLFLSGADNSPATADAYKGVYSAMSWASIPLNVKFLFLASCAVVSTSLLANVLTQHIKLSTVLAFCLLFLCFVYPITGHWIWGGGWLADQGFWDFAGSTVIFSVGGWAALVSTWVLSAVKKQPSVPQCTDDTQKDVKISYLGFLILCLAWIALNTGSTIGFNDGRIVNHIVITTIASAIGGAFGSMITCSIYLRKQDATRIIQGVLSGLVAISAPCAYISTAWAIEIGFIASILTFLSVGFLKKVNIHDPVGLIAIHLAGGIWGTLSVGLFASGPSDAANALYSSYAGPTAGLFNGGGSQLFPQLVGIIAVGIFTSLTSWIICSIIKFSITVRVT